MTLILPVGGEPLVSIDDCEDLDSGCLSRSTDDVSKGEFSVDCESLPLKSCIEPEKDESKRKLEEESELVLSPSGETESVNVTACEALKESNILKKAELQISINCDKDSSPRGKPLVIYECRITVDSMPEFSSIGQSTKPFTNSISCTDVSSEKHDDTVESKKLLDQINPPTEELSSSLEQVQGVNKHILCPENVEERPTTELRTLEKVNSVGVKNEPQCEKIYKMETLPPSNITSCKHIKSTFKSPDNLRTHLESSNTDKSKIRKFIQRRSISESSTTSDTDFSYLKKTRTKLRHSFSSYDNCDKLRKVLDRTSINREPAVNKNETSNSIVTSPPSDVNCVENRKIVIEDSPIDKVTRKSCFEISDTLVNNVKKSMIEEYKNLKKHSSLANHDSDLNLVTYDGDSYRARRTQSESEGYPRNIREAIGKTELERVERIHNPAFSVCNTTPAVDIRGQRPGETHSSNFDSVVVESGCDLQVSKSLPLTNSLVKSWGNDDKAERVSSPPTRLEIWKNILAEKRNSIKNHIKGFSKQADHSPKVGNTANKTQEIVICRPDQNTNSSESSVSQCKDSYTKAPSIPLYSGLEKVNETEALENNKNICIVGDTLSNKYESVNNNGRGKDISPFCNNFICINSLHLLPCINESTKIAKVKMKTKLEEACQGIAKALDTLPEIPKGKDLSNNNKLVSNAGMISSDALRDVCNINKLKEPKVIAQGSKNVNANQANYLQSDIVSIITTIPPPTSDDLDDNEKSQQCPTPPAFASDDEEVVERKQKGILSSSEEDSDYCQTDECGDECDYCSGEEAEDEEEEVCRACLRNRSLSQICKHTRVITNGSLQPLRKRVFHDDSGSQRLPTTRPLAFHSAMRRRPINHQELSAIREYSITSDDQQDSDEEESHDDSMCDISSSWRFGLCDDHLPNSVSSTIKSGRSASTLPLESSVQLAKLKSNSLPASSPRLQMVSELPRRPGSVILKPSSKSEDECGATEVELGIRLPPRPPRTNKIRHPALSVSPTGNSVSPLQNPCHPRPTMGLQGLQQRPSLSKLHSSGILTGPKTLAPRSPLNPNPPFGFPSPPSPPIPSPGGNFDGRKSPLEVAPSSPRTNSRSGALVTRNFSISDDEGGQRLSRRQVTITRHESAFKEAADKKYLPPQTSPIDPYWLNWKLGVLQKTVEDVGSRLGEAEKEVGAWGPMPQDPNLADQSVHNIRKFRETLPDLQRGIDDVNDQAARFSAHNVPLSPANTAALHDLNNRWKNLETTVNDRWRQVAGRSREVTPLTPAQLASSVTPPWERATATNKVPYYINHAQETTHWDHPQMMDLLDSLSEFNHIKFSAYRTATKLRSLQKKLSLDRAKLQLVTDVFDEHGLRGQNDRLIDVNDMVVVLSTLYGRIASDNSDVNTTLATDLCLNWLLNVYDSQRTGQMRVLSFRVGLISLCRGHLEEKYRYMFRLIADPNRMVDQRKLGLLLHDCVQVPRQLGEVAAFGGSNIEPSVRSCFTKAGKDRETIEAVHFLTWVQQEPQSLVWLAVLHRVAASESVQHQVKCNICKTYPIVGLRYRCLKCLSFDMCQRCFFEGRSSKSHKITHPMHEYCTATTAGDEMKDFTKALKNKFKSKRSLQKHTKKGYLPVQTVLEGDPLESPSPSPSHNVSSQDMHSRLELYASRLAEVELRTNSNSTPDSEDEHGLIAQYCQSLSSSDAPYPVPKSPLQIMASVDADQKDELEQMIRDLEEENRALQAEYERLKSEQPSGTVLEEGLGQRSEAEMLAEAKLLREHKGRLEARMSILEDHNRQLEAQLQRLRQLLVEQQSGIGSPNKSGTLQTKSVTASQLAMDSPAKINGHSSQGGSGSAYEGLDLMSEYVRPPPPPVGSIAHMGNLFSRAGDLEKAVGSLVASMNQERENGSHSDDNGDKSDENDYDNTVSVAKSN